MDKRGKANGKVANVAEAEEVFKQFALQKTKEHKEEKRSKGTKKNLFAQTQSLFSCVLLFFAQQISARKFNK